MKEIERNFQWNNSNDNLTTVTVAEVGNNKTEIHDNNANKYYEKDDSNDNNGNYHKNNKDVSSNNTVGRVVKTSSERHGYPVELGRHN